MALIEVRGLSVDYQTRRGPLRAVDEVDLDIRGGETLGIVGESGSGKSTLAMAMVGGINKPNRVAAGSIVMEDVGDVTKLDAKALKAYRWAKVAMVFQGAQNTLNPLLTVAEQARLVMKSHGHPTRGGRVGARVGDLCRLVNLEPGRVLDAYPHQLSGGMKQRVGIVMALLLDPPVVVLDEPTTALDVISQARILEYLAHVHESLGTTMVFITHDMSVIAEVADRIAVMYAGRIAELGTTDQVFYQPAHPYTQALMRAIPTPDADPTELTSIPGRPPDLRTLTGGCRFAPRCASAHDACQVGEPELVTLRGEHRAACVLVESGQLEEVR